MPCAWLFEKAAVGDQEEETWARCQPHQESWPGMKEAAEMAPLYEPISLLCEPYGQTPSQALQAPLEEGAGKPCHP